MSHDEKGSAPRRFLIDVEETIRVVLEQEDTDGDFQISVTDAGPKMMALGTATSNGFKSFDIRVSFGRLRFRAWDYLCPYRPLAFVGFVGSCLGEPAFIVRASLRGEMRNYAPSSTSVNARAVQAALWGVTISPFVAST